MILGLLVVTLVFFAALLWVLAVPCLTDGTEGNRMRYPVSPCVLLMTAWTAAEVRRRAAERRSLRLAGPGRAPGQVTGASPPATSDLLQKTKGTSAFTRDR